MRGGGMKCKDCKHWIESEHYSDVLHSCDHPKAKIGYRYNPDDIPTDGVWIENDEGWGWFTGPEFGCVNFEEKKDELSQV